MVKAREFCGEEQYESDSSTFQSEIDDSRSIMETLSASKLDDTAAVSIPINQPSRQVDGSDKIQAALEFPTNAREDAASVSARTEPPSKKRKAKAGGMDNDYKSALTLLKAPNITAQWLADGISEAKVARRDSKKERKGQKQLKIIKHNESEPRGYKEYFNESAYSQESATKEGGRKGKKKGECPFLNNPSKPKAFIEQHDDQVMAEETLKPRKGRKRKRHRTNEMPADAILSYSDGNKKSSTHRHSNSRETTSDETRAKELQDLTHPMIQLA